MAGSPGGLLVSAVLAVALLAGSSVVDFMRNPHGYSRKWRLRRWLNWFFMGLTYAGFYMARYNMSVLNNAATLELIGITPEQFGEIISTGFWAYAAALLISSPFCDAVGGRQAYLLGSVVSGVCNVAFGIVFWRGAFARWMLFAFVCINYTAQAVATNVMSKISAGWYSKAERGTFGGVFGVINSCGYYLAFGLNGLLLDADWSLVFIVPGAFILACTVVTFAALCDKPPPATFEKSAPVNTGDTEELLSDAAAANADDAASPVPSADNPPAKLTMNERWQEMKHVIHTLSTVSFGLACGSMCCAGFLRENLLTWFTPFLDSKFGIMPGSSWYTVSGASIMVFGSFGGIACGLVSDRFFHSQRPPAVLIFLSVVIPSVLALYFVPIGPLAALLVGFTCFWLFGAMSSLNFTHAMDVGGPRGAATATGCLAFASYIGAGAGSVSMASIIEQHGYLAWTLMLAGGTAAGLAFTTCVVLRQRRSNATHDAAALPPKRDSKSDVELDVVSTPPNRHHDVH